MKDWQASSAEHQTSYYQRLPPAFDANRLLRQLSRYAAGRPGIAGFPNPSTLSTCQAMRTFGFTLFLERTSTARWADRESDCRFLGATQVGRQRRHRGFAGHSVTRRKMSQRRKFLDT